MGVMLLLWWQPCVPYAGSMLQGASCATWRMWQLLSALLAGWAQLMSCLRACRDVTELSCVAQNSSCCRTVMNKKQPRSVQRCRITAQVLRTPHAPIKTTK